MTELPKGHVSFVREIEEDQLQHRLAEISRQLRSADLGSRRIYVRGMGSISPSTYAQFSNSDKIKVVWTKSVFPPRWRWLRKIIASEEGLVRVDDLSRLGEVFSTLSSMAMAGIYVFGSDQEPQFLQMSERRPQWPSYTFGLPESEDYFVYVVDTDNAESSTGMYEIVSYGTFSPVQIL